jgi:hypothetical protein
LLSTASAVKLTQTPSAALTGNYKRHGVNEAGLEHQALSPIQKVVTLLREMKAQTVKEGEEDQEAYDKYGCWCVTTKEEKTAAIEAGEARIADLTSFVEEGLAKEGELKTEIAALEEDIAQDKEALATATAMREKENAAFLAEQADLKETLQLLSEAIAVLGKVQLIQKPEAHKEALIQVQGLVRHLSPKFANVMQKDLFDMLGEFNGVEHQHDQAFHKSLATGAFLGEVFLPKKEAAALTQEQGLDLPWIKTDEQLGKEANPNDLKGMAASAKSYNARSGQILGILKQQGDYFAKALAEAQKEEMEALVSYHKLAAAKTAEIEAATNKKNSKEAELADLLDALAKAKEEIETTQNTVDADTKFLAETTKTCAEEDQLYAARVKVRSQEIVAIGETLDILSGDEARSLFNKQEEFQMFLQVSSSAAMQERAKNQALQKILQTAKKNKNWQLAALAVRVKLDAFTKVKEAMDKMLAELRKQQSEDYEKNEACKKDIDTTEDEIKEKNIEKRDLKAKHDELSNALKVLHKEIDDLKVQVEESEISLKQAGENRKAENHVYQTTIADQRAMIHILNMALVRLQKFYAPGELKKEAANVKLIQRADPPPKSSGPEAVGYSQHGSSGGVMQMIQLIVEDATRAEDEMHSDEQKSQADYAELVQVTTQSIEADRESIAQKEKDVAQTESEKSETEEAQLSNQAALDKLNELLSNLHAQCDYIIKYFKIRQESRAEEISAIEEAKAILSGADFGEK